MILDLLTAVYRWFRPKKRKENWDDECGGSVCAPCSPCTPGTMCQPKWGCFPYPREID